MVEKVEFLNTFKAEKRLNLPPEKTRIGRAEREILRYITIDFLTLNEIVSRRKCTPQAVYKIVKRLKEKGLLTKGLQSVENVESTQPFLNTFAQCRLHGQEWNIKLITKTNEYFHAKQRGNTQIFEGNTIRLYNDSIEIYSGQSFFERDEKYATAKSLAYWLPFFHRLEHYLGVTLVKPRVQNINLVNQHYGETNSEMAKDSLAKKEKIKIETTDDGKLWFVIDNSWNLKEAETIHPETAKHDMGKIRKQLNDWRDKDPPTNSELASHIGGLIVNQEFHAENIVSHVGAMQSNAESSKILSAAVISLEKTVHKLTNTLKGVLQENRRLKLEVEGQKTLVDFFK